MSTVGFTTTELLEAKLSKVAADHNLTFQAADSVIAARRLLNAYQIIVGKLIDRGMTLAAIATWSRGEEFQLDIATWWYGCDSGWNRMQRDDTDWLTVFKREKELDSVVLLDSDFAVIAEKPVAVQAWDIDA
jgi:hypothetical protein